MEDFERNMDLLADTGLSGRGRWIVTPRKGMAFIGPRERAKERARERRRRVFVFMLESIGLTALIGIVPPLRAMWYVAGILLGLLGLYAWLLVSMRTRDTQEHHLARAREAAVPAVPARPRPARQRYAADAGARTPRAAFNGPAAFGEDPAGIVVLPAEQVGAARV